MLLIASEAILPAFHGSHLQRALTIDSTCLLLEWEIMLPLTLTEIR
jgi:hypothetical protein